MSWGIWKKIKQGVAKVGGFVRNLLGGAPKVINNTMDTVNTLGKKAMRGVKRASKIVQQFRGNETESEDEYESIPKFKSKIKTKSKQVTKSLPKWRKLLDATKSAGIADRSTSKYTVNYAGRSWMPKMKNEVFPKYESITKSLPKNKVKSSQKNKVYSTIDDSEDFTE